MKAKDLARVAVFTALTIAGAQIYIPIGSVPITLQVLFVILSGLVLKEKRGFVSQFVYVLMGLIGLPVFAGFKGGIVHMAGPTGGYIISFPIASWVVGKLSKNKSFVRYLISSFTGLMIIYSIGVMWLVIYVKSLKPAFLMGVLPFIPWDIIKAIIASFIAYRYESNF